MSLTGTRKDPFLLPDSLPLNNIRGVGALISPPFSHSSFFSSPNLLDFLLDSSLRVAGGRKRKKNGVSVKY